MSNKTFLYDKQKMPINEYFEKVLDEEIKQFT